MSIERDRGNVNFYGTAKAGCSISPPKIKIINYVLKFGLRPPINIYHTSVTNISLLMTFGKIIAVYYDNRRKSKNTFRGRNAVL